MSSYFRDDGLQQLVKQLNAEHVSNDESDAPRSESGEPALGRPSDERISSLLRQMIAVRATDLHLVVGVPPAFRVNGDIRYLSDEPLAAVVLASLIPTSRSLEELNHRGSIDFSLAATVGEETRYRYRINVHRQRGVLAASVRVLPTRIPSLADLNLPASLLELTKAPRGLVLVCGPTGSGKSTTLAALIDDINRTQARHIITIEDPLEYEHRNIRGLVEQIEIHRDAPSFAEALRSALRQDPDVILVGEMRDLETVSIALTAAETGHLVFSTLHTSGPAQAVNRIVDVYPSSQQTQVYKQIALSLHAVLHQKMLPRLDGRGIVPAVELLIANIAVRHQIRNGKLEGLANEIVLGKRQGMISLDDSLEELMAKQLVSHAEAVVRANSPEDLRGGTSTDAQNRRRIDRS